MPEGSPSRQNIERLERDLRKMVIGRRSQDLWPEDGEAEQNDARIASRAAFEAHISGKLKLPPAN